MTPEDEPLEEEIPFGIHHFDIHLEISGGLYYIM